MSLAARLRRLLLGPESDDGVGQSLWTDLRWLARLRRAKRRPVIWRTPTDAEARHWQEHPVLGRFADSCHALAEVDGRRWVVLERDWYGWPDPPRFAWFVLAADDTVWAGADFNDWPAAWKPLATITV